jgi:hypothetical protein
MFRRLSSVVLFSVLVLAGAARADQCAWVTPAQAAQGAKILKASKELLQICEPCGDKTNAWPAVMSAKLVTVTKVSPKFSQVFLGSTGLDLAYLFVPQGKTRNFGNVAKAVGCKTQGVSPEIRNVQKL